jgi:hypothetical protein
MEKAPLGVEDLFEVRSVRDLLDLLLKRQHLVVASRDNDVAEAHD